MTTRPTPWHSPARLAPWVALPMARTSEVERRLTMILDPTRSRRQATRRILFVTLTVGAAALLPLAALRPAAHAQATPAVPALPDVRQEAEVTPTPGGQAAVPVGLAGVTDAKGPGGRWWSASGVSLSAPVFDDASAYQQTALGGPGQRGLIFAFRLPPTAQGVTTLLEAPESLGSSSSGVWPGKMQGQENATEAALNQNTGGMRTLAAIYPASAAKASLRVGIAAGPWKVSASRTIATGATTLANSQKFIFSPVAKTASGLSLTITTDATDDVRVVVLDAQGQERLPVSIGGESIGTLDQITARFSQPLSQIKSFRVETRPFTWTEFKDVALRPSGAAAASAEEPEARAARRLQQICTLIQLYRTTHGGTYPAAFGANGLIADITAHPQSYELPDQGAANAAQAQQIFAGPGRPVIAYFVLGRRPDGTQVGAPKPAGTRDVLAYTNLYVRNQPRGGAGFYLVLWDDGTVGRIPVNRALQVPAYDVIGPAGATEEARRQGEKQIAFPGQAGLS